MKALYPFLSKWIERLPLRFGKILCNCMVIFMVFNCLLSGLALTRYEERQRGAERGVFSEALPGVEKFLDGHFGDERMERIYPNAKLVE